MKKLLSRALMCALLPVLLLSGCGPSPNEKVSAVGFYLDTVISIAAYGVKQEVVDDALNKVAEYENLLSKTIEGSDVWNINHANGQPVTVSDYTREVLEASAQTSAACGGAFDITVAPSVALWDFKSETPSLPDAEKLSKAAKLADYTKVKLEGSTVTLPAGMQIELGSIAKGYITDKIAEYCRSRGVKRGILNFGGNVVVIGGRPDGAPWNVGIQDPIEPTGQPLITLPATDSAVVTSGVYERGFTLDGVRYHHILDPKTGWPVQNGLASVTILTKDSLTADAYDTACFVMGLEKGMALVESIPGMEAVFIDSENNIHYSSGLQK
ncbi:MAG TPA: FAD:protein FMN transferase [Feifaniaceae bacterium]|nr:FAD:protein FMN transferase [Feifaniaceae bacterium]